MSYGAVTEGEGVEPPSPCGPPVFETGYRAGGSPSSRRDASVASVVQCGRQESNLRRPAFQAGALPAELRPRASGGIALHPSPLQGRSTQRRAGVRPLSRPSGRRRCFPCHSLTLRPWIVDRRLRERDWSPSYVEGLWSPTLSPFRKIARQIQLQIDVRIFARARRAFLSRAGPRSDLVLLQAGHHLILVRHRSPPKRRRRPIGSPSRSCSAPAI